MVRRILQKQRRTSRRMPMSQLWKGLDTLRITWECFALNPESWITKGTIAHQHKLFGSNVFCASDQQGAVRPAIHRSASRYEGWQGRQWYHQCRYRSCVAWSRLADMGDHGDRQDGFTFPMKCILYKMHFTSPSWAIFSAPTRILGKWSAELQ